MLTSIQRGRKSMKAYYRKTNYVYGAIRAMIREHIRRYGTITALDLPQPREMARKNLTGMMKATKEITIVKSATYGRFAEPAVYAKTNRKSHYRKKV